MSAPRPVLELLVGAGTAPRVEVLVRRLAEWCDPRAPDPGLGTPAARLATSTDAPGLAEALDSPSAPVAVWADADLDPRASPWSAATALLTDDEARARELGDRAVLVPRAPVDGTSLRPLPVSLRAEWRALLGLPDVLVVGGGVPGAATLPSDALDTALALASAAAVVGSPAVTALALGTPVVTDGATAEWLGARHGEHVVVSPAAEALATAHELARDADRCAALGASGRRLVEERHDVSAAAWRLAVRLGIAGTRGGTPHARARAHLAELGADRSAPPAARVLSLLATLPERAAP